jgi:5-deoxy-glucuronate isomerase
LEPFGEPVQFANPGQETGLVCLKGRAIVKTEGERFALGLYDAVYIPRGAEIWVTPDGPNGCDLAEFSAPVDNCYPLQLVRFEDVRADPGLHFRPGDAGCKRDLNILIGKNVQAGRIVAGVTFSEPGNWTSWPPHEHAELLEEAYVFIAMPPPAWGIQLVYTDPQSPEVAVAVREGDCVVMPRGYHPNVSTPGTSINFLWMMAARREGEDRQFGVVNVQPEYANNGSGLEAGRG